MTAPSPPQLLGRTAELEILDQLIVNVRSGQSAVLVVRGEPGIGKTALLRHLIGQASGFRVIRATGIESEMELPFAGLHQLCAPMLGRLDSLAEPQRHGVSVAFGLASGHNPDPFLVALGALSLMAETSEEQPLLCVVDDAHWLDQASAQILGFVGRRLLAESIALVFAARTPPQGAQGPQGSQGVTSPDHLAGLPELELARQTYLEALVAAIYAGRLAHGQDTEEIARAARVAPFGSEPLPHSQLLLRGLAVRMTDGYEAAAPTLKEALRLYRAQPQELNWLCVSYNLAAMDLWDDQAWFELAAGQVRLARANGTLSWLPFALDYLAENHIQAGQLSAAEALLIEAERIDPGIRAANLPYISLLLAAWRGDAATAAQLTKVMIEGASDRGEGTALTYAEYANAVLHNSLGNYGLAAEDAHRASAVDELVMSPWALHELVEAATRSDQRERAAAAADQLSKIAAASGSDWACGAAARSRALLAEGRAAEEEYREAIERLSRTRMATHLARARLSYGEWLRRENRRIDARNQLRPAFDAFASMGTQAWAERARRELVATGERVRKRTEDTHDDLTPQEEEIAQLARDGLTNPEIGAQLFIGARTVEWHLRKVFAKLYISSRRELDQAMSRRGEPGGAGTALK